MAFLLTFREKIIRIVLLKEHMHVHLLSHFYHYLLLGFFAQQTAWLTKAECH